MRRLAFFWMLATTVLLAAAAGAQEASPVRIEARVEQVAGQNAYLNVGAAAGLAADDTLDVYRVEEPGLRVGQWRVVNAAAERAVTESVDEPFAVTRGERFLVAVVTPAKALTEESHDAELPVLSERVSLFDAPPVAAPTPVAPVSPRFAGRVQVGTSALWSSTSALSAGSSTVRQFATPFLGLRGHVTGLPAGLRVNLNGRLAYRYRSEGSFDEPTDLRLYHASVEGAVAGVDIEAGRFYNEHDRYSGYLDGVRLHVVSENAGVGVTGGVQPDRADGVVSTDLPKYTVYGHLRTTAAPFRLDLSAIAGQILPQQPGFDVRTFAGASLRARTSGLSLAADALADRAPDTGDLVLSRFLVRGSWTALPRLRLRARYTHRRPYLLTTDFQALLDPSERVGGGLSYTLPGRLFGGTVVRADIAQADRSGRASLTYSGGVFVPRLPAFGLGLNASGSVWTREGQQSIYVLGALTRTVGRAYVSLGYSFQQTPLLTRSLTTHGVEGTLQVPLTSGVSLTVQASGSVGDVLTNARLYTGLWWRL